MKIRWMLCTMLILGGCHKHRGSQGGAVATAAPKTEDDKTLYALGMVMGEKLQSFHLSPAEAAVVQRGLSDKLLGKKSDISLETYGPKIGQLAEKRENAGAAENHRAGDAYAQQAAQEPGATKLPSGLVYKSITEGTGPAPAVSDEVTVHYRGTLIDGTEFDSSRSHGQPATFQLGGVIPCWTEGLQRMKVGGKSQLVCPPDIAYGDHGKGPIPAGSTLIFEVELISTRPAGPPAMPSF